MPTTYSHRPTVTTIDLDALAANLRSIRDFIGKGIKMMAVVKANAYGHGMVECSKRLEAEGVDWFGVATTEEAVELRDAGILSPILCFGSFWPGQESIFIERDITPVIFDLERADSLNAKALEFGRSVNVHIKIDTGMGRVGVPLTHIREFAKKFKLFETLRVEGLMSHFAAADDLTNDFTNEQMGRFADAISVFDANGFHPTILDIANSPGAIAHSDPRATMVRIGGILYGLYGDVLPYGIEKPELQPVLSLQTKVAFLKNVAAEESIGYGRTWIANRDSVIATLPIGYHDGLPRVLSNKGRVLINGEFAPIVGRISMDWTTIDVTNLPNVELGDEVVLIGTNGSEHISAESIAAECDTISYEITCGLGSRVPRIFR